MHKVFLFENRDEEVNIGQISSTDWIKLNNNSNGIYRTNYSIEMLNDLFEPVRSKSFHATDRLGILDDLFNLVFFFIYKFFQLVTIYFFKAQAG